MAFDLNALGTVAQPDMTAGDWATYDTGYEGSGSTKPKTIPEGVYTLQIPTLSQEHLATDFQNYLQLAFEPVIADGSYKGQPLGRLCYASIQKFKNRSTSAARILLERAGIKDTPLTNDQWLKAFAKLSGKTFTAYVQWAGKDKNKTPTEYIRGEENWPMSTNGKFRLGFIVRMDGAGQEYRVWANPEINWLRTLGLKGATPQTVAKG